MGVLSGIRIVEFEGIGPAPFAGMMLADMGADVIVVERCTNDHAPIADLGAADILKRGKKSIALDLKHPDAAQIIFDLLADADGLIEGLRPGVMERLGFGPEDCLKKIPHLVFGRVTGWGQTGPLAQSAGHDINYTGLSGAAWLSGHANETPFAPPTLVGDIGGGALYLTVGMLAALLNAKETGKGNVVDAAIVDGSAHMMNLAMTLVAANQASFERGRSMLNGAPWFDTYACQDGKVISIGPVESKFYTLLLEKLGLDDDPKFRHQHDSAQWPAQRKVLKDLFLTKTCDDWRALLEGSDVCFAPVLSPDDAARHPHMKDRQTFYRTEGALQAAPAPRFERGWIDRPEKAPERGEHTDQILLALGRSENDIDKLKVAGVI